MLWQCHTLQPLRKWALAGRLAAFVVVIFNLVYRPVHVPVTGWKPWDVPADYEVCFIACITSV